MLYFWILQIWQSIRVKFRLIMFLYFFDPKLDQIRQFPCLFNYDPIRSSKLQSSRLDPELRSVCVEIRMFSLCLCRYASQGEMEMLNCPEVWTCVCERVCECVRGALWWSQVLYWVYSDLSSMCS